MSDDNTVSVHDNPSESRYEITVGEELAGYLEYERQGATTVLESTQVLDGFGGRGIGSQLVQYVLDDVRASGANADVQCPFVDSFIDNHREYEDLRI